ncbi:MAG TPA: translation elongation factor Ts [Candidatus Dormibacteraeota bacterium]|nr:translation elongation factor Ts [Candidatus Dormibacteraeota bacterium]
MKIDPEDVKRLRDETGAGVMDCKRALEQAKNDLEKAKAILREQGFDQAAKKAGRATNQGVVEAYVHASKQGALVELNCETDFVARNDAFRKLAREVAMQVAGMGTESVDALLEQPYIRDQSKTIRELVTEVAAKTGENVQIGRIAFFKIGG